MDEILAKASNQAVSFAIRSGISIASGFAIKTVSRFLDKIPQSEKARIEKARSKLKTKVSIVSSSIDLIKLESARGGSALEPALQLANDLQHEIDQFDEQMVVVLHSLDSSNEKDSIKLVERSISLLVESINDAIPLINLSLITSGVSFANSIAAKAFTAKLLHSSHLLCESNQIFSDKGNKCDVVVGPRFDLKLYTVFYNPSRFKYVEESVNQPLMTQSTDPGQDKPLLAISWKEEYARASCTLIRSKGDDFKYRLLIRENFSDERYHDDDEVPRDKIIEIKDLQKQFFSASGRLLRLEGSNSPVLTMKLRTPAGFDYVALEEVLDQFDDNEEDTQAEEDRAEQSKSDEMNEHVKSHSLSLLESLLRLSSLQETEQASVLDVSDQKLSFYLDNYTDGSAIPKLRQQRDSEEVRRRDEENSLALDSNTSRLETLSLGE